GNQYTAISFEQRSKLKIKVRVDEMSFASDMKNELTRVDVDTCCQKSELSALIKMNGALSFFNGDWVISVQTENAAIARRIFSLIKNLYGVDIELLVRRKMKLKKNNVYISRVKKDAHKMLSDLNIIKDGIITNDINEEIKNKECCIRSYLRGAFLAGGSVNNPETSAYHLEGASLYEDHAKVLTELMNGYELNAKYIERKRGGYITYLKGAEKIAEFLSLIG